MQITAIQVRKEMQGREPERAILYRQRHVDAELSNTNNRPSVE